jgi:hypothetical protein
VPHALDDLGFDVDGNDPPCASDSASCFHGVSAVAGTDLQHSHARLDAVAARHFGGRLDPPSERIVNSPGQKLRHGELVEVADDPEEGMQEDQRKRWAKQYAKECLRHRLPPA